MGLSPQKETQGKWCKGFRQNPPLQTCVSMCFNIYKLLQHKSRQLRALNLKRRYSDWAYECSLSILELSQYISRHTNMTLLLPTKREPKISAAPAPDKHAQTRDEFNQETCSQQESRRKTNQRNMYLWLPSHIPGSTHKKLNHQNISHGRDLYKAVAPFLKTKRAEATAKNMKGGGGEKASWNNIIQHGRHSPSL